MTMFWDSLKLKLVKLLILMKNLVLMKKVTLRNQVMLRKQQLEIRHLKTMEFHGKT